MTIAEKLVTITEKMQNIYKSGQKSMIDESKIIKKTVTGQVLSMNDISEVPHDLELKLTGDENTDFSSIVVNVYNKNLFEKDSCSSLTSNNVLSFVDSSHVSISPDDKGKIYGIRISIDETFFDIGDTIICRVSSISNVGNTWGWRLAYSDGSYSNVMPKLKHSFVIDKPIIAINLYADMASVEFDAPVIFKNISVANIKSLKKYNADANGTVTIKSTSPSMHILTDENGINLTATYHKSWGLQEQYDRFWDAYQNGGKAMDYSYSFAGVNWDDYCYNPKYPIKCTTCTNMFRNSIITDAKVDIDLSEGNGTYVFANCRNLVSIPKIIVNENVFYTGWLTSCVALVKIRFEGVIANSLDVHYSTKLSAESYESILSCLSTTSTDQTLTLPTTAEATYNAKYGSGAWAERVKEFTNWEIKYA